MFHNKSRIHNILKIYYISDTAIVSKIETAKTKSGASKTDQILQRSPEVRNRGKLNPS